MNKELKKALEQRALRIASQPGKRDEEIKELDIVLKNLNDDEEKRHQTISTYVKVGGEIALGVAGLVASVALSKATFKFEESGAISSKIGQWILSKSTKI